MAKNTKNNNKNKNFKKEKIKKIRVKKPLYEKLNLKQETMHIIYAGIFLLFALFFILASVELAGPLGKKSFKFFTEYLGIGYYVIPLTFFLISYTFFKGLKQDITKIKTFGISLFATSLLGIFGLFDSAGIIGEEISSISEYLGP